MRRVWEGRDFSYVFIRFIDVIRDVNKTRNPIEHLSSRRASRAELQQLRRASHLKLEGSNDPWLAEVDLKSLADSSDPW